MQTGFIQRKGKQLLPTKDGINLAVVLPEVLTSPALTTEWESHLTEIAKGEADPDEFISGIETQARDIVKTYSCISEDKQKLFQTERVAIGTCPRCGEVVYEDKKNHYCGNRACQFVMWKNERFFEEKSAHPEDRRRPAQTWKRNNRINTSVPTFGRTGEHLLNRKERPSERSIFHTVEQLYHPAGPQNRPLSGLARHGGAGAGGKGADRHHAG